MKKSMNCQLLVIAFSLCLALYATGCGSKTSQQEEVTTESAVEGPNAEMASHVCPMHPEITGKEGDKCSKCGMTLEAVAAAEDSTHHHMDH